MTTSNLFWGEEEFHMYKTMIEFGVEVERSLSVNETTAVSFISVNTNTNHDLCCFLPSFEGPG